MGILEYLQRVAWDPTAPVPAGWPHRWPGALLLFCIPGGAGIPPGVLLARADGLGPAATTLLYVASDLLLALAFEPLLRGLAAGGRVVPALARLKHAFLLVVERAVPGGFAGGSSVVLTGFGKGLPVGRALAAAAGHGMVSGWLLTIAGDLGYFAVGMTSTLWFDGMLGDPRLAALAGLVVLLVVPMLVRRLRRAA
jgi:hypothetical protein